MRRLLTWGVAAALGVTLATPAAAQVPAVGCEVSDFSLELRLYMPLSADGSGGPASEGIQGSLDIRHSKIPVQHRRWSLDGRKPAMFWNRGGELKMLLLLGTGEAQISLVIETSNKVGGGEHTGNFRLESKAVKLTGRLACAVG